MNQERQDFLEKLTTMSREEITQFLINNGKKPKGIRPFIYLGDNKESRRNKTKWVVKWKI